MSNLISVQELRERLDDPKFVVVDTRFNLKDPAEGRRAYEQSHLPGAVYFDLDQDLSSPKGQHGGRHPLPDLQVFVRKLEHAGIGNTTMVVAYDDSGSMYAGRLWWLLKYLGHDAVKLLDGGLGAWREAGFDLTTDLPKRKPALFTVDLRPEMLVDMAEVRAKLADPGTLLIDARAVERYRGDVEPLDPKAGHIPGAINKPFTDNLEAGRFKRPERLKERFHKAMEADEVIVYCGSGVTAAHNLLALDEAGITGARLYAGSWSDWSSYDDNPVATGDEP
jgi:thiosulfate/3-mercaptopyruvate sulfurtransferase